MNDYDNIDWSTISRIFKSLVAGGLVLRWQGEDVYTFIHDDMYFGFTKFELKKLEHEHGVKLELIL